VNAGDPGAVLSAVTVRSQVPRRLRSVPPEHAPAVAGLRTEDEVHAAYTAHGPELYRFLLRGLGDPGAAQDVVQETFLRAWRSAERYDPVLASLRVWLFAIARNAMVDHARAAGVRPWHSTLVDPPAVEASAPTVDDPTEALVRSWVVEEALLRLTPEHRTALVETQLKERPYGEVAGDLGVPVGTLRSRVFYALKALRVAMDEMGVTP
jgi:RNA polymerase sigma-70 factor (ECF subfamily)